MRPVEAKHWLSQGAGGHSAKAKRKTDAFLRCQHLVADLIRIHLPFEANFASGTKGALEGTAHLQVKAQK